MATIGFLGLGAMGRRMAKRLLDGNDVRIWNRSDAAVDELTAAGAVRVGTPGEAASRADFVISMLTDDEASRAVWLGADGACDALSDGAVAIESSTITPAWARSLAKELPVPLVEAPVSGSRPQADSGSLVYFVAGDATAIDRARPVLKQMGSSIHLVGSVGNATVFKLAVNVLFATQVEVLGELLGMLDKAGVSPSDAMNVIGELPVTSAAAKGVGALIAAGRWAPQFPIDLVAKDMNYAVWSGEEFGAPMPVASAVRDVFLRARESGHGASNINAVAKLFL